MLGVNRFIYAWDNLVVRVVNALLPLERRRDHEVATDKFGPLQDVAECGAQHPGVESALDEDLVGALDRGNAGPLQVSGVDKEAVALGHDFEPVVKATGHNCHYRSHFVNGLAFGYTTLQPSLDGLSRFHCLRYGEGHRHVDRNATVGGLLDRLYAHRGAGDLDDDVWRKITELFGLVCQSLGVAMQPRIGLDGETTVSALVLDEDRLEELCGFD